MYFWRIWDLVARLEVRELSEAEGFRYFLANMLLMTIGAELPVEGWNVWDQAGALLTVVITALGILYCFRANGGAAGESFLPRMMAISWVVTLRTIALTLIVALVVV